MQTTNNTKQIFLNKEEFIDELAFNFMQYFNIRSPKESIERAENVYRHIEHCIENNLDMQRYAEVIADDLHSNWIARQVSKVLNGDPSPEVLLFAGPLKIEEVEGRQIDRHQHSDLFFILNGTENMKKIDRYKNLVDYKDLQLSEQAREIEFLAKGVEFLCNTDSLLKQKAQKSNYPLETQLENLNNEYEQKINQEKESE